MKRRIAAVSLVFVAVSGIGLTAPTSAGLSQEAERLLANATRMESEGRVADAMREYELLVERFPESEQAPIALLRLATARRAQGDSAGALATAHQLIERYPDAIARAGGLLLEAEIQLESATSSEDLEQALASFVRVPLLFGTNRYARLPERAKAKLRAAEVCVRLGRFARASSHYLSVMEDEPSSPETSIAAVGFGKMLAIAGNWVEAADVLRRAKESAEDSTRPEFNPRAAAMAADTMTMIHRLELRPSQGAPPWQHARPAALSGATLRRPVGVAARDDGALVVVDDDLHQALVFGREGQLQGRLAVTEARKPFWGVDGVAYLALKGAVRAPLGRFRQPFQEAKGTKMENLKDVVAVLRNERGEWQVLDRNPRRLLLFAPDGKLSGPVTTLEDRDPVDLARDIRGRVYVLDRRRDAILRLTPNHVETVVTGSWKRPEALAIDFFGNLYVLDRDRPGIDVFGPDGARLASLTANLPGGMRLSSPRDIAVDGAGRVFIADRDNASVLVLE